MYDLRELRQTRGVSLKMLAKDLGVDTAFLSRLERGEVPVPERILAAYSSRFGKAEHQMTLDDLGAGLETWAENRTDERSHVNRQVKAGELGEQRVLLDLPPAFYVGPNPHLGDLVDPESPVKVVDQPYAGEISAGKNSYVYDAHTYHTKVPPEGIKLLIEQFTNPGGVVLDPFCGSGMTGVAALELGRKAILNDLSPAATFIAYNLATPMAVNEYRTAVMSILSDARQLELQLYGTHCRSCGQVTPQLYTVWSFGVVCPECGKEFVLWDVARDERETVRESKIKTEFDCPHCGSFLKKRTLKRTQRYPVQLGYKCCGRGLKEATATLDPYDCRILEDCDTNFPPDLWYPTNRFPDGVNTRQPINAGIDSVDKAYTRRALWAMSYLWQRARTWPDLDVRSKLLFTVTSLYQRVTHFSEFRFWGGSSNTANFSVPAISNEQNVFKTFERKANTIALYFGAAPEVRRDVRISTQSACWLPQLPDRSIDYIFTDPPFGANINYSEMNFLWESWLGVFTNNREEAIVNKVQRKGPEEYGNLLRNAFREMRRVVKDGAWITIIFHNSSAAVWEQLRRAIDEAGLEIKGTQTFDKRHGTFKQFVSDNSVGYDLVLHCQKAASPAVVHHDLATESLGDVRKFIVERLRSEECDRYRVHYRHVDRSEEFNYRRLYAEWLAHTIAANTVNLGFGDFRSIVDDLLTDMKSD